MGSFNQTKSFFDKKSQFRLSQSAIISAKE